MSKITKRSNAPIVTLGSLESKIYIVRAQKVMLDKDLATLYGVETRSLNQAVKRNLNRFPVDFMFSLTDLEEDVLGSQIVIAKVNLRSTKHRGIMPS